MQQDMIVSVRQFLGKGAMVVIGAGDTCEVRYHGYAPVLRVGDRLESDSGALLVVSVRWTTADGHGPARREFVAEVVEDCHPAEEVAFDVVREGYALAWVTLSDKGAAGLREDASGPSIERMVRETLELSHVQGFIIPDDEPGIRALITSLALEQGYDLVLTTGGTGVGPRDVTPQATLRVIDHRLPGYERAMTNASLRKTPHGAISRAVAGCLGNALIINLPGSPKAVAECLAPLLPTLRHTLQKLHGDPSDCAALYL